MGGALGITLARTALVEAGAEGPPCHHAIDDIGGYEHRDPRRSWRACLQLLAAGDYLSPTVLGMIFRDTLALVVSAVARADVADRATFLEQAIEEHYNAVVGGERTPCGEAEDRRGLCRPFGYLPKPGHDRWLPLSSSTRPRSTADGRSSLPISTSAPSLRTRRIARSSSRTPTASSRCWPPARRGRMRDPAVGCLTPGLADADDLRLSTTAVMSARFPVVSPKGNLRNRAGTVIEQVVDGRLLRQHRSRIADAAWCRSSRRAASGRWSSTSPTSPGSSGDRAPTSCRAARRSRNDPHHVRVETLSRTSWADALEAISPLLALNSGGRARRGEDRRLGSSPTRSTTGARLLSPVGI